MDKKVIEDTLRQILSERLEVDAKRITQDSKLRNDLGVDSFGVVELSFEIKDKFGVTIADQDFSAIVTVKDVIDYIFDRTKEK